MAERVEVMLSEEEVDRRIQEIGEQISKDYAGKQVQISLFCLITDASRCFAFSRFSFAD